MEKRILATIAEMQVTLKQLDEGLISRREARDKCVDALAQHLMSVETEAELEADPS